MKENLELALIGRGAWGQNYARTIESIERNPLPSERIKGKDYKDLLETKGLAGVIIASSTSSHAEIARVFLEKGISVLVEKPMTRTVTEAESLRALAKKVRVFMVGHTLLYAPEIRVIKENLDKVGNLKKIFFEGLQSIPRTDSSVIQNWGPHPMYLAEYFFESGPFSVEAKGLADDNVLLTLDFAGSKVCEARIGCISQKKKRGLEIHGDSGKLVLDWSTSIKTLTFEKDGVVTPLNFPSSPLPLEAVVLEFLECIKTGNKPLADFEQGFSVIETIEKAEESLKTSRPIVFT